MLKLKKLLSILLSLMLIMFIFAACARATTKDQTPQPDDQKDVSQETPSGEDKDQAGQTKELPPMTTEKITLTYASWENHELNKYLAQKFMEKYPNITVELIQMDLGTWNDGLINLASAGKLPDVFWYLHNCDLGIRNGWFGDMTEYFENDPETEKILDTLRIQGYFDGKTKMAAPAKYLPFTVFLDKNVFRKLNVPMPSPDWTYDEMIELMERMTVPEQGIFGYNTFTKLVTIAPIVNLDAIGEFGWDGEKYDMTTEWAKALNQHADFVRRGVHAPPFGSDEAERAFGDRNLWAAATGKVAMQLDAWWTLSLFAQPEFVDKGIEWVPYPVPRGANAKTLRKPAFVDFGAISSSTKYPREAYELLKFMGWGKEGWLHKLDAYANLTYEDGTKVFTYPDNLPIIDDPEIWQGLRQLLPPIPEIDAFLERAKEPVPLGGASHPGFAIFLEEVYFNGPWGNVEEAVIRGEIDAFDVAQELTDKLNQIRQETMEELFGNK